MCALNSPINLMAGEVASVSDDYEERIREDWRYTYRAWDAADDRRRFEREQDSIRLGFESARLVRCYI